jgi:peptide/nickel transport system substrate-binding protein
MDEHREIKPQMVEHYEVSADKLTYKFTLRDGLIWHDGEPVTSQDCVASLKRWSARDVTVFSGFIGGYEIIDSRTFSLKLKEPTGLVLSALGKSAGIVPFMMPRRVAETDPNKQISEFVGSGPFIFRKDEWRPGERVVYAKFDKYQPRPEPASGFAGGKVVKVDRVEWRAINDHQQAVNALLADEIDVVEQPPHDLYPLLKRNPAIQLHRLNQLGSQYLFRPNWLAKPFDHPLVRKALWYAFNQQDFLNAAIGDSTYYMICKAYFICGTPLSSEEGTEELLTSKLRQGTRTAEGSTVRWDAHRAPSFDGSQCAREPGPGRQTAVGAGRIYGGSASYGLADPSHAAHQERRAPPRRLAWLPYRNVWC